MRAFAPSRRAAASAAVAAVLVLSTAGAQELPEAIPHALEPEPQIIAADAPWTLVQRAEEVEPGEVASLLLPALSGFIEAGELAAAHALVERLQPHPLSGFQRRALRVYEAQLAQKLGRHARAVALLRGIESSPGFAAIGPARADILRLLADSQMALRRNTDALVTLLRRDALPLPHRAANQMRIMALIDSLDPLARLLLREAPPHPALPGWLALNDIVRAARPPARAQAVRHWRARHPDHPARQFVADQQLAGPATTAEIAEPGAPPAATTAARYRHIAVLLPLTSAFGAAAQAFFDGFMAAHTADWPDPAGDAPLITLHDLGADAELAGLYYRTAAAGGADFVVGPLGRQAVRALLAGPPPQLPVLVVSDVPAAHAAPNLFGISLSPEREAAQVAARAFFHGHRRAGILAGESDWQRRAAAAFADAWRALGGQVVASRAIPREVAGYARAAQTLLGIDRSIGREKILTAQLDANLEFNPRRRDDLDFLFLATAAADARLLVPHLRFYQAHDLPLYATSRVYDGGPAPATDADLDGIVFGDLAWVIDAAGLPRPAPDSTASVAPAAGDSAADSVAGESTAALTAHESPPGPRALGRYFHTGLDRLYALGLESYRLIPELARLRAQPWARHYGEAADLSVGADGNARRHLTWARFERGLPLRLPGATAGVPLGGPGGGR